MRLRPQRFNLLANLRQQYLTKLEQIEQSVNDGAMSLPTPAGWTKRLTLGIVLGLSAGLVWSIVARVDVVVDAPGKLEPLSQSQGVQSKTGGTVTAVLVREGELVQQGQMLMQIDKTPLFNQLQSLLIQRNQLVRETAVLRMARYSARSHEEMDAASISPELRHRVQTRMLLVAQLSGDPSSLSPGQRQRYDLFQQQLQDLQAVNQLQGSNLEAQAATIDAELDKNQFQAGVQQELLTRLQPLMEEGAISRTLFLQRTIEVNNLEKQLQQNQLQRRQLEINQIQSQVQGRRSVNQIYQDLQKQLLSLDQEFDATIQENQRRLIQINAELNQIELSLKDQDLRAPIEGVVFDLQAKIPGMVAQPGQSLLQIVPDESLIARVQVANHNIANIRVGMPVDVRIDAYPFAEFGAVEGIVTRVGSEALPIDNQRQGQTVFPVEIRLQRQFLQQHVERSPLVPGMSLTANIKVRERAPIGYVTEELTKAIDGMRSVR
ncbi:HlyD family type I secretion periplasmic adaptor subunit [Leptolyngbya ohadii]|uniref:HlyD family type I secretion periplasmic adaptor subunit n=1 Tax=Leptolyngbya ohadii TaxID=1962290 RepID=UPI000B59BB7C|nr:HlyD family type I secretion periplasmic adaptor subunit [Leptolyngbya ohadii]